MIARRGNYPDLIQVKKRSFGSFFYAFDGISAKWGGVIMGWSFLAGPKS